MSRPPLRVMDVSNLRDTNKGRAAQTIAEQKPVTLALGQTYENGKLAGTPKPAKSLTDR